MEKAILKINLVGDLLAGKKVFIKPADKKYYADFDYEVSANGKDFIAVLSSEVEIECQGECKKHGECKGEVKPVRVIGDFCPHGMQFNYCQTAREVDEQNGFTVIERCN